MQSNAFSFARAPRFAAAWGTEPPPIKLWLWKIAPAVAFEVSVQGGALLPMVRGHCPDITRAAALLKSPPFVFDTAASAELS